MKAIASELNKIIEDHLSALRSVSREEFHFKPSPCEMEQERNPWVTWWTQHKIIFAGLLWHNMMSDRKLFTTRTNG